MLDISSGMKMMMAFALLNLSHSYVQDEEFIELLSYQLIYLSIDAEVIDDKWTYPESENYDEEGYYGKYGWVNDLMNRNGAAGRLTSVPLIKDSQNWKHIDEKYLDKLIEINQEAHKYYYTLYELRPQLTYLRGVTEDILVIRQILSNIKQVNTESYGILWRRQCLEVLRDKLSFEQYIMGHIPLTEPLFYEQ